MDFAFGITGMKKLIYLVAFINLINLIILSSTYAQETDPQDSIWREIEKEMKDFKLEEDFFEHYSHGWFPSCYRASTLTYGGTSFFTDVYDKANFIQSTSFVPTVSGFCGKNPFIGSEQEIKEQNNNNDSEDGYPVTSNNEYKLSFTLNTPLPLQLRFDAGVRNSEGMLFANDTSRSFVNLSGVKQNIKEVSVLYLNEYNAVINAGLQIPFYGVFMKSDFMTMASYYYIRGAINGSYAVYSDALQYFQIADVKENLRYTNGYDTATVIQNSKLSSLNRLRTELEFSLGWNATFEVVSFNFEAFSTYPITSVVSDARWEQYFVGFRMAIGAQFVPSGKTKIN